MIVFAFVAAMTAGGDTGLAAALAVTAAGILAFEVSGLAYGDSYRGPARGPDARDRRAGDRAQPGRLPDPGRAVGGAAGPARAAAGRAAPGRPARRARPASPARSTTCSRTPSARSGIQIQAARAVLTDHGDIDRAGELLAAAQRMAAEGLAETRRAVHALRADTLPLDEELARASDTLRGSATASRSASTPAASPGRCRPTPRSRCCASPRRPWSTRPSTRRAAASRSASTTADADVRLTVRNDLAPGGGPERPGAAGCSTVNGGYGLTGMRERLRLLNGTLRGGPRTTASGS